MRHLTQGVLGYGKVVGMQQSLESFKALAVHDYIDPFFEADIDMYYQTPGQFSLALKRSSTRVALYGKAHVAIRQQFFNGCDTQERLRLFKQKVEAAGISDWITACLNTANGDKKQVDIVDVCDVGKGRTIYKVMLSDKRAFVLKEKENEVQAIYNKLAGLCGVGYAQSWFIEKGDHYFELTQWLDDDAVFHYKKEGLIDMYARAAAFGDLIGLGDRHFENYIATSGELIAIDAAHIEVSDNDHWTKKYIAGGLYECCVLQYYVNDPENFGTYFKQFFSAYNTAASGFYHTVTNLDATQGEGLADIQAQWSGESQFLRHMGHIYGQSLQEMVDRLVYKQVLAQLVEQGVALETYPELKMYYFADKDRLSTFFRMEDMSGSIFDTIQVLASEHLGVTGQYFKDHARSMEQVKGVIQRRDTVSS